MMSSKFYRAVMVAAMIGCFAVAAVAAEGPVLQVKVVKPGVVAEVDRFLLDSKVVVTVVDLNKKPVFGLTAADFDLSFANRPVKVLSSEPISENKEVPRHIALVLDNSDSMRQREAIKPLLEGVGELLKAVRPIDDVQMIVFDENAKMNIGGHALHVKTFKSSEQAKLKAFANKAYDDGLSYKTYLYEGMMAGFEFLRKAPDNGPRFMMVFTDGKDLHSAFKSTDVTKAAKGVGRFDVFAIDYMPGPKTDPFLTALAKDNHGQIYKAASEKELVPVFQNVASEMSYYYILHCVLAGKLAVEPASLKIEEVKTVDSSPMLGQVFFAEGSSEIPPRYARFAGPGETAGFDEQKFNLTMEKYYQVLNIVGKRLNDKPEVKITLVGCNSDTGKEKGKKALSAKRAAAVRDYLQTVWNIAPERMTIEARNMPAKPSARWQSPGQDENRRVEIVASDPTFLAPVRSIYLSTRIDASRLTVGQSEIPAEKIAGWKISALNTTGTLTELSGSGAPTAQQQVVLPVKDLKALAAGGDISVKMDLKGKKWINAELSSDPVKVSFLQTSERIALKQGLKVQEKYSLILFDFNKDTIGGLNQVIIDKAVERLQKMPDATVEIIGHTDTMGKEAYNTKLSQRRALAVYTQLALAAGQDAQKRIRYSGVGPKDPLYENESPEGRSFNRTVTITIEYQAPEEQAQ